jgi:hypothetical protein
MMNWFHPAGIWVQLYDTSSPTSQIAIFVVSVLVILYAITRIFGYRRQPQGGDENGNLEEGESTEFMPRTAATRVFHRRPTALILFGTVLILGGIAIADHGYNLFTPSSEYLAKFLSETGFALIIAYFVTMGIEAYSRESHNHHVRIQIERIKKNVFAAIYKKDHDPKLIDFVDNNIFRYSFYRLNYQVRMRITYLGKDGEPDYREKAFVPKDDDLVHVGVTLRSAIKNTSSSDHDYTFETFIEKPYLKEHSHLARLIKLTVNNKPVPMKSLSRNDDLNKEDSNREDANKKDPNFFLAEDADFKVYSYVFRIERKTISIVEAEFVMIKYARDELTWRSVDPADGFYISVEHPCGLHVFGTPLHKETSIEPTRTAGALFELFIREPLFPHNGAAVWWAPTALAPKNDRSAASERPASKEPASEGAAPERAEK